MPRKILIVDDDPSIIMLLKINLEMEGYEVISAQGGAEGVEKAKRSLPDLIIMDVMMPNMDGWTAKQELHKSPEVSGIPVIFLSARAQQADLHKGYEAGAAEYMTKPFEPMELIATVEQILAGTHEAKHQGAGQ